MMQLGKIRLYKVGGKWFAQRKIVYSDGYHTTAIGPGRSTPYDAYWAICALYRIDEAHNSYGELCVKVSKFNIVAANEMSKFPSTLKSFKNSNLLGDAFLWNETPQGFAYWDRIADMLYQNNKPL